MARHRDAEKQQRQNLKHRSRNRNYNKALKTALKTARTAVTKGDTKPVAEVIKLVGKTASAGVIHKRKASRLVSRLMKAQNRAKAKA